ncbi:MAG TPA: alpha/beta hydrolase family protein [Acidimicrobiales bacterium]|nr:alpha/beta hydrolase family protein [Acidimicrobiales bacterium]
MSPDRRADEPLSTWFGPEESPLFGILSANGSEARGAVILCPPLGREHTSAYPTFARLAAELAQAGLLALRFDYRSTGDSFDRADQELEGVGLLEDVRSAVDFVRGLGVANIALVGMRVGALLAGLASAVEPFDALVMWDPCASGRSFVREQRMLSLRIQLAGRSNVSPDDIPGFLLPPEILRELSLLEFDETTATLAERVLLLTRVDQPVDRTLVNRLVLPHVEQRKVLGQPELLDMPTPLQVIPAAAVATIVDWLDEVMPKELRSISLPESAEVAVTSRSGRTSPEGDEETTTAVVEKAVRLGPLRLFAISTEPKEGATGPVCLFVNVANEHRIGPGRLWVDLGRRLAASGLRCVRLDLSGVGDSPARGSAPPRVYPYSAIEDVVEVARALTPEAPSNVVLFGLCSSGYHVLEAAAILSPRGVCALNPAVSFPAPEMQGGGPADPRRKFFLPEPHLATTTSKLTSVRWLEEQMPFLRWIAARFPSATVRTRRVLRSTLDRLGRPHRTIAWRLGTRPGGPRRGPGESLTDLVAAGSNVLLICGSEEMRPFRHAADPSRLRGAKTGNLQLEVISALDHALRRPRDRDEVSDLIIDYTRRNFLS